MKILNFFQKKSKSQEKQFRDFDFLKIFVIFHILPKKIWKIFSANFFENIFRKFKQSVRFFSNAGLVRIRHEIHTAGHLCGRRDAVASDCFYIVVQEIVCFHSKPAKRVSVPTVVRLCVHCAECSADFF